MLASAAVALLVAALALLSPLERKLRDQELRALVASGVQSRASFRDLEGRDARPGSRPLQRVVGRLARETGARIALLDEQKRVLIDTDPDERDRFEDFSAAVATDRPIRRITERGTAGEARVALRVRAGDRRYVLALRKPLDEQRSAVGEVRRAFLTAAIAALAAAVLLATGFTATVLRRLRRLRDASLRFDARNPEDLPVDRHHDEVGDLTRAITEMRERIVRQEQVRRAFVATASHELRTPLMSLHGQLELLHEDLTGDAPDVDDARRQLDGARTQTDRLARLAADLLDLSRLDAQLDLRSEAIEFAEVARAVAAEFDARANERGTPIELPEAASAWATGDPGSVARVLRILIDNALRFAPPGTPVRIAVNARETRAEVTVTDSGPGIPEEDRERVFERFARGGESQDGGGFGLGLAIGRELAERMHGTLELTSASAGATAFTLALPVAEPVS